MGRLQREKRGEGESPSSWHRHVSYTYDADSNRVGADNALDDDLDETYTYDTNGRLDRVTRGDATYTVYSWTANGEQQQVSEFNASHEETRRQTYTWGGTGDRTLAEVRLYERNASGTLVETGRVEYDYDHAGEKIARRVYNANGGLVSHRKYLIDHQNPTGYSQAIAELDIVDPATGNPSEASNAIARIARLNTFDPLGPVAQTDFHQSETGLSKTRRHLFADPLGSIRALTSRADSGTIQTVAEDYTAFGAPLNGSLTPGQPHAAPPQYAFTAQTRDPYSGLQYHRARWLNTGLRQWSSPDPVFDFRGNFGSVYGYAAIAPVSMLDPAGTHVTLSDVVSAMKIGLNIASQAAQATSNVIGLVGPVAHLANTMWMMSSDRRGLRFTDYYIGMEGSVTKRFGRLTGIASATYLRGHDAIFRLSKSFPFIQRSDFSVEGGGLSLNLKDKLDVTGVLRFGGVWNLESQEDYKGPSLSSSFGFGGVSQALVFIMLASLVLGAGVEFDLEQFAVLSLMSRLLAELMTNMQIMAQDLGLECSLSVFHNLTGDASKRYYGFSLNVGFGTKMSYSICYAKAVPSPPPPNLMPDAMIHEILEKDAKSPESLMKKIPEIVESVHNG